jgi:hypothetical protein
VGKTQKVECIRFTFAAPSSVLGCKAPKFNQSRFVPVQGRNEIGKPLSQLSKEPFCFAAMLRNIEGKKLI